MEREIAFEIVKGDDILTRYLAAFSFLFLSFFYFSVKGDDILTRYLDVFSFLFLSFFFYFSDFYNKV